MNKTTLTIVAAAVVVALASFGIVKSQAEQPVQTPLSKPAYKFNEKSQKKVLECVDAGRSLDECIRIENFRNIDF